MFKPAFVFLLLPLLLLLACGGEEASSSSSATKSSSSPKKSAEADVAKYDPTRGEGKFTSIDLDDKINAVQASAGASIAGTKCQSCHKLTDERLVGPGWKGVTERRTPVWLMNFITNPNAMIDKDPELQAQLELCLVRMPDQNLSDDDARRVLEFMRKNDQEQK